MSFDVNEEKSIQRDPQSVYQAGLKAAEKLQGNMVKADAAKTHFEVKFPKTILGKTLGDRTYMTCDISAQGEGSLVKVNVYPLDALERKLMFGARKGVSATVVTWFFAHLEHNLGVPTP
jgi:hypothetical protein